MKKLLSIVLVMAMLLSLAIAIPVSADTTTETVSKWDGTIPTLATDATLATLFEGEGTEASPYLLKTAEDVAELAAYVNSRTSSSTETTSNKYFRLDCDIDIADQQWPGIGAMTNTTLASNGGATNVDTSPSFQGKFDGNGHVVYNLNFKSSSLLTGFFNCVTTDKAIISNFGIVSGNITLTPTSSIYAGALVGYLGNKAQIKNCFNMADIDVAVKATSIVGGLVGWIDGGAIGNAVYANIIDGCWNSGDINIINSHVHAKVGGIVGQKASSSGLWINNTTNIGNITNDKNATQYSGFGGVIGEMGTGLLKCSFVNIGGNISVGLSTNYDWNTVAEPVGVAFGYAGNITPTIESCNYNTTVTLDEVKQNSPLIYGYDYNSNATTNFTKVESITISDTTMLSNNFAQNGIDENAGNIRFVSELGFSAGAFSETGYVVEFATKSAELGGKVVYTSLKAADAEAEGGYKTLTPTGKYYIAYGISDIPTTVSGTVTVTPYVVLLDGTTTVYGASAEYTITAGVLQQNS